MPARMHSFYLRNMYIHNAMGKPGGIELDGVPIDLSKVTLPSYFISTVEDHIAPWKTTYKGAQYLGSTVRGAVRFVLGGSGHIAGIVNPPAAKKYHYWTNDSLPETAEKWFESATQRPGSWWEDWQAWIEKANADAPRAPARIPKNTIEDAPGRYAKLRLSTRKNS
jgi:polyhydroxyalkanoate synthase